MAKVGKVLRVAGFVLMVLVFVAIYGLLAFAELIGAYL